ncbi:MAG: class I mannose-6-phosphate isomerase [Cyclobacteriaceae bacterium]|nr:class I mannose-6-phosphate isomerase [Cyclobacteriaceae bacterium]
MSELYPLKFKTIFKDKIWGGQKIKTILNKDFSDLPNCGETWEISGVEGNISIVEEGPLAGESLQSILKKHKGDLVGEDVYKKFGDEFPLLVKFIDANDDLSVQVHPDDALAKKRHNSFGKTEMWYVFQADEDATLNSGFNRALTKAQYLEYFDKGQLMDILNIVKVKADDVYFLPAGRVHYIGKGCLLAEIQQSSDVTYRMYDFDRKDDQGNLRELHTEDSLDAIDFTYHEQIKTNCEDKENEIVKLVSCDYFTTNKLHFNQAVERDHSDLDSFVIYVCMEGGLIMEYENGSIEMQKGDAVLVPANIQKITMLPKGEFKLLESYIV